MNTLVKSLGALAMAGVVGLGSAIPAEAAWHPWMNGYYRPYVHHYYRPYYRPYYHPYYYDPGPAIVGGFIGGVFGSLAGSAIRGSSHVARCERAYRTYSAASNTFVGYDGKRHVCRL